MASHSDEKLSPKELVESQKKRTKKARKNLEPVAQVTFTGNDIGYYRPFSGAINIFEQFHELGNHGLAPENRWDLNFSAITNEGTIQSSMPRRTSLIDPDRIYTDRAEELIDFAASNISPKRAGKLDFVRRVLEQPDNINFDEAIRWFDERDQVDFARFNETVSEEDLDLGKNEKVLEQTINEYWKDLKNNEQINNRDRVQRGLVLDLTKTLQSLAFQRDDDFKETVDDYEVFFRRYQPEKYRHLIEKNHEYEVLPIFRERKHHPLVKAIGSCLARKEYGDFRNQHMKDPFTFVHAIGRDGKLQGYMRSFVMEDNNENNFLGIDTVEIPKRGGIDLEDIREVYENNQDILQAGLLGLTELGERLGIDYIAGRDARVKFGLRQPFSNTQKKINYRKLGSPVPYYSVAKKEVEKELATYTPINSDIDIGKIVEKLESEVEERTELGKWDEISVKVDSSEQFPYTAVAYGQKTKRVPGFEEFPNPGNQDLRGFRTEQGWHTNHAYILMEFP